MRSLSLIALLFALSFTTSFAQNELVKQYSDITKSANAISHTTDEEGNIYLVGFLNHFYNDNMGHCGGAFSSTPGSDMLILKIDTSGKTVWEKRISDNVANVLQISVKDSLLFIPYLIGGSCAVKNGDGPSSINCGVFLNKYNGAVARKKFFNYKKDLEFRKNYGYYYQDDSFTNYELLCAAVHKDNSITYVIAQHEQRSNNKVLLINRNDTLGFVSRKIMGTISQSNSCDVAFDQFNDEYIIADSDRLEIYNRAGELARTVPIPAINGVKYPFFKITCNQNYYVVNYGNGYYYSSAGSDKNLTIVLAKNGEQISKMESPFYGALLIDKYNIIYAIPIVNYFPGGNTTATFNVTCMDIHQVVINQKQIGMPYVKPNNITCTDNNEIIITGTSSTTASQKLPKTPNGIYYYRESLSKW